MAKLRQRVADLLDRTRAINRSFKRPEPNADVKTEGASDGGLGKDATSTSRPKSLLEECPARPAIESCKPEFENHLQHGGSWHTHLIFGDMTLGCGVGGKREHAQKAALAEFLHLIGTETELPLLVERALAARRALGDAFGGTSFNDPLESKGADGGKRSEGFGRDLFLPSVAIPCRQFP